MKKLALYALGLVALSMSLFSCSEDSAPEIVPSNISNVSTFSLPGQIGIKWDVPTDSNYKYVKVSYYDFLKKKDMVRLASVYSDTIIIPNTRAKYGTYTFTLQPVSSTGTPGEIQTITGVSGAAPASTTTTLQPITLTADMLSTNAQEPTEGPIANLLDGSVTTFFHSTWSATSPDVHYLQINLKQELTSFQFYYANRQNGSNKPTIIDVAGSTDGTNWNPITTLNDNLPVTSGSEYTSAVIESAQPFTKLRLSVTKTNTGSVFFTMSEFKLWKAIVSFYDPEAADN